MGVMPGSMRGSGRRSHQQHLCVHGDKRAAVRTLVLLLALLALLVGGPTAAVGRASQDTVSALAGYPELRVRASDDALSLPVEVPAGRYLLVLENASAGLAGAYPMLRPAGLNVEQMQAGIQAAIATPEGRIPDWFYETTAVGGPFAPPGAENAVIVDLAPGVYGVLNPGNGIVAPLEVVARGGATPVVVVEPPADLTVMMREYAYVGLPERVAPGAQVWTVTNSGEQPNELALLQAPTGTTFAQVMAALATPPDATPAPGGLGFADLIPVGGVGYLSPGQTAWAVLDLAPGTYVALCFVPDRETGMPHAAMGMAAVFTVGEAGATPVATPGG